MTAPALRTPFADRAAILDATFEVAITGDGERERNLDSLVYRRANERRPTARKMQGDAVTRIVSIAIAEIVARVLKGFAEVEEIDGHAAFSVAFTL